MAMNQVDSYTWDDVLALCREARRHRDFEVRSAILTDLIRAIDHVAEDEAALESSFRKNRERQRAWQDGVQ